MQIVINADSEYDYHVTIIYYNGEVEYFFVDEKIVDNFIKKIKE